MGGCLHHQREEEARGLRVLMGLLLVWLHPLQSRHCCLYEDWSLSEPQ